MSSAWLFTVPPTVSLAALYNIEPATGCELEAARQEYSELVEPGVGRRFKGKAKSLRPEDKARGGRLSCYREQIPSTPLTSADLDTVVPPLRDPPVPEMPVTSGWRQANNADVRSGTDPDARVRDDKPPPWKSRKASPAAPSSSTGTAAPSRGAGHLKYQRRRWDDSSDESSSKVSL